MDKVGDRQDDMWDEQDGFYYDVLRLPDGEAFRLKVRSMVGPAAALREHGVRGGLGDAAPAADGADRALPEAPSRGAGPRRPDRRGVHRLRRTPAALAAHPEKLERILSLLLDESEFLCPYGIRSLSRHHLEHPFVFHTGGQEHRVEYLPAESNTGMFGGNSNWRGPIWMPVNALIVRGLLNLYGFYGDDFKVECPTGSGNRMTLFEVAKEISRRLAAPSCATRAAAGRSTAARRSSRTTRTGGT